MRHLALAVLALGLAAPSPAQRHAIQQAFTGYVHTPGSPAAKDNRIVSTLRLAPRSAVRGGAHRVEDRRPSRRALPPQPGNLVGRGARLLARVRRRTEGSDERAEARLHAAERRRVDRTTAGRSSASRRASCSRVRTRTTRSSGLHGTDGARQARPAGDSERERLQAVLRCRALPHVSGDSDGDAARTCGLTTMYARVTIATRPLGRRGSRSATCTCSAAEARVLVTGFEPFGGSPVNTSQIVAEALGGVVLPVSYARAADALREAVRAADPDVVICFGQADREAIGVERFALNLDGAGVGGQRRPRLDRGDRPRRPGRLPLDAAGGRDRRRPRRPRASRPRRRGAPAASSATTSSTSSCGSWSGIGPGRGADSSTCPRTCAEEALVRAGRIVLAVAAGE